MIREWWLSLFENILPTDFILCKLTEAVAQFLEKFNNVKLLGKVQVMKKYFHMS
uniref:Uncharacterized protein n=1 Tax=Rhizophagus irregularis (strain DAOM 181602 / DAOM 197198 / MUCL 43194) TaxID=747089 RepID=U9T6I1_RHIID